MTDFQAGMVVGALIMAAACIVIGAWVAKG